MNDNAVERTRAATVARLLDERNAAGVWQGELCSSALSTATAVIALASTGVEALAQRGAAWLAANQNADGGWGDTTDGPSNLSTTTLAWVALGIDARHARALARAEEHMRREVGELTPERIATAIERVYGDDRTFAIPILTTCALSGRFGSGREAWRSVRSIPFEIAALPHQLFRWLGLPMVSYALPALIAIGQVIHHHRPTRNPLTRTLRGWTRARTLDVLASIQPATGGFLEATPLTSFVVMSLVGCGRAGHTVVENGVRFLRASARADGSWPIDTNLTTWVTTLAVNALAGGGRLREHLAESERATIGAWLAAQQFQGEHAYTHSAPGGWAWTDLAGGVPDADDTAGALLALKALEHGAEGAAAGSRWLAGVQNRDGGIPTFCRGWGKLPFDRSSSDLTAHALRAWDAWQPGSNGRACARAVRHLVTTQRSDGSWVPLWFGNQHEPALENPLYGTSRVVQARDVANDDGWSRAVERGDGWILAAQNRDGGFGGAAGLPSTVEETALAVEALADSPSTEARRAVARGAGWLVEATDEGTRFEPSPIGLYFAKLWYSERLYPLIFTAAALERASR